MARATIIANEIAVRETTKTATTTMETGTGMEADRRHRREGKT